MSYFSSCAHHREITLTEYLLVYCRHVTIHLFCRLVKATPVINENEMADYSITTVKNGEVVNGGHGHKHPTSLGR